MSAADFSGMSAALACPLLTYLLLIYFRRQQVSATACLSTSLPISFDLLASM